MKKFVILVITVLFSLSIFAQMRKNMGDLGEKYHAQKVAYITNALDLSSEESAAFWPIYNEHEKKKRELSEKMRKYRSDLLDKQQDLTEEEAKEALDFIRKHMDSMHMMENEYQNKFLEVISAKKVLLLMNAEKDFRRELLKKLGERRNQRGRR